MGVALALQVWTPVAVAEASDVTRIYVSAQGADSNDGSIDAPFQTLKKAKNAVREMKSRGEIGTGGAVVYIRGGDYRFEESLRFTAEDSGTKDAPITYAAYPGEKVNLVGSIDIRAKDFKTITDESVLAKITYPGLKEKIKYINLKEYGLKDTINPPLYGPYSYMVTEPLGGPKKESPFEIIAGDQTLTLARYPNGSEQMQADEIVEPGAVGMRFTEEYTDAGNGYAQDDPIWQNYKGLTIRMKGVDRVKYWGDAKDAIMDSLLSYDWARQSIPIASVNPESGTITTKYPSAFTAAAGRPWNIYNLLEELDVPGEYYIDKVSGNLYVYLSDDAYARNEKVSLSVLKTPLLDFQGASNINIKNIGISGVRSKAINVEGGSEIHIYGCEIYNIPTNAVYLENSPGTGLDSCYIHDVDYGMYLIGGDFESLTPSDMYVTNCEFQNFSKVNGTYTPAIDMQGVGHRVTHNKIHDSIHEAVQFFGNNHYFAYNEVYDVSTHSQDSAAIYGMRNMTGYGNVWEYNYIHDVGKYASSDGAMGSNGIYFDDGNAGGYVAGNVFEHINGAGVFAAGRDCNVTNNIFVDCSYAATAFSKRDIVPDSGNGLQMMNRIRKYTPWVLESGFNDAWKVAYPDQLDGLFESMTGDGYQVKNEMTGNVVMNSPEAVDGTSAGAKIENNFVTAKDPGFYDLKNRNYTLKKDSAVYEKLPDFKPVPFTRMGKVDERAQQRARKAIILAIDSNEAILKGENAKIDPNNARVVPKIKDSRTYVPIRFIAEAFGIKVDWDEETRTVSIDNGKVEIHTSSGEVTKDGVPVEGEAETFIDEGRTFLPLRLVSELLDYEVFWDDRGFISVSDVENLFSSEWDSDLISYLYNGIAVHYKK